MNLIKVMNFFPPTHTETFNLDNVLLNKDLTKNLNYKINKR